MIEQLEGSLRAAMDEIQALKDKLATTDLHMNQKIAANNELTAVGVGVGTMANVQ